MPQLSKEDVAGLQRTFIMYSEFPRWMFPVIKVAEKDDKTHRALVEVYKAFREKIN